jgi:kynurenine formamidase
MTAKVYDLEQPRSLGMTMHPTHKPAGYRYLLHRRHRDTDVKGPTRTGASGVIISSDHAGTHIDALCHQALNHELYGNIPITSNAETPYGVTSLGIETVDPIVSRGILLDVARAKGVEALPKSYRITVEDLKTCLAGATVNPGDVVLVRTGYANYWNDEEKYLQAAGVSVEGSEWLASFGVKAVGADNMAFEVDDGSRDPKMGVQLPCHVLLIVKNGIHIIENLNLEKLASDKISEFIFVCLPLKMVGATGSPVRPVAIRGMSISELL